MGEQRDSADLQTALLQHTAPSSYHVLTLHSYSIEHVCRFLAITVSYLGVKGMGWEGRAMGKILLVKSWGLTGEMKNEYFEA